MFYLQLFTAEIYHNTKYEDVIISSDDTPDVQQGDSTQLYSKINLAEGSRGEIERER